MYTVFFFLNINILIRQCLSEIVFNNVYHFKKITQERATFEAALDWLCLNLRGNELPLKFSSGTSQSNEGID